MVQIIFLSDPFFRVYVIILSSPNGHSPKNESISQGKPWRTLFLNSSTFQLFDTLFQHIHVGCVFVFFFPTGFLATKGNFYSPRCNTSVWTITRKGATIITLFSAVGILTRWVMSFEWRHEPDKFTKLQFVCQTEHEKFPPLPRNKWRVSFCFWFYFSVDGPMK